VPWACKAPPSNCMATLAETEACLEESIDGGKKVFSKIPQCTELTRASLNPGDSVDPESGPACRVMETKCPGYRKRIIDGGARVEPPTPQP
jgi:hypothetical protein